VAFESRPPDKMGRGAVTIPHLLHSSLRLRPDRIVIGEVRGGEAFDLMQAMNTGHSGSMCTVHANSPTETCRRLESLCLMSEIELPMVAIRAQIASALNIVICCARFHDGSRRLTHIAEVLPLNEKGDYRTQDLFVYTVTGKDEQGRIQGYHAPTGMLPTFMDQLEAYGYPEMDESFFDPATYGYERPPVKGVKEFKIEWTSRLKDGAEQSKPKPLDSERKERLTRALNEVFEERDKVPPPTVKHEPPAGSPEPEKKEAEESPEEEAKPRKAGAYARELLKKTTTDPGTRTRRTPLGVRDPKDKDKDKG
jgi:pilus assembly protein CpaF